MSIAAAKLTCYELVKSRNGSYPSLMAAAVNVLILIPLFLESLRFLVWVSVILATVAGNLN